MTDWERVERLRAKGSPWEEIAGDRRVGFSPPSGADPGRTLRVVYYRRRSRLGANGHLDRHGSTPAVSGAAPRARTSRLRRGITIGVPIAVLVVVILVAYFLVPSLSGPAPSNNPGPGPIGSRAQFQYLSAQGSDVCQNLGDETANINWVNSLSDNVYIQGSCCTPMDWPDYSNQTSALPSYASISIIPPDPYNLLAEKAKVMVANVNLPLTAAQQSTLNGAIPLTSDHGFCCCECWAYYAHEGMAKTLIVQYGYDSQQVATVLNLEDCCGGPGQMNMP